MCTYPRFTYVHFTLVSLHKPRPCRGSTVRVHPLCVSNLAFRSFAPHVRRIKRVLASKQVVRLSPQHQFRGLVHDAENERKNKTGKTDSSAETNRRKLVHGERELGVTTSDEGASGVVLRGLAFAGPGLGRGCCK